MFKQAHLTSVTITEITDLIGFCNAIHDFTGIDGALIRPYWLKKSKELPMTLFTDQKPEDREMPRHDFFAYNNRIQQCAKIQSNHTELWTDNLTGKPIPDSDPKLQEYIKAEVWYDSWVASLTEEQKGYLKVIQSRQAPVG